MDEACLLWARTRSAPTLLIETKPSIGITEDHVEQLLGWAGELSRRASA